MTGSALGAGRAVAPEDVVKRYVGAVYARDYGAAYDLISLEDRRLKTKEEYVRERGAFSGAALEMARDLASLIRYRGLRAVIEGDRATLTGTAIFPNASDPAVESLALEFDETRLSALSQGERKAIRQRLEEMARTGRLPVIVGENETWDLVREEGTWRVLLNWAGAVVVRFEGVTKAGLPWEFAPVQPALRIKPGETLHTSYRVKNLSNREISAKARHILDPPEKTGQLQILSCFCFIRQTLKAAESKELPVVVRVNATLPASIKEMKVRYEFYPLQKFPGGRGQ